MTIKRDIFDIALDATSQHVPTDRDQGAVAYAVTTDHVVEHRLTLIHRDTLRAELECHRRAIPATMSVHMTSAMLWSAAVAAGVYGGAYDDWQSDLVGYERVDAPEAGDVPPTSEAAPSGPVSS